MEAQTNDEKSEAQIKAREYLNHLLNNGIREEATEGEVHLPPWYNEELFKRAQYYFEKYFFALFGAMSAGLIAVLGVPSILQVLIGTKQSNTSALAYKRYIRTILHVKCWYESPLKPGSDSWRSIDIVRNAHFKASKICKKANHGIVTQKDLAITQFGFIGFITLQGKIPEDDFYESNIHFWRVIGYMIGIEEEYNLCTNSWLTTKPRMNLILTEIYRPSLENTDQKFKDMTTHLINGLWCLNSLITLESSIFITKWLAGCKGYEYLETDFEHTLTSPSAPSESLNQSNEKHQIKDKNHENSKRMLAYKNLSLWDRFIVNYFMIITLYLYQYNIIRLYMNFRTKLSIILIYYFPFLAFIKFGIKWAYVRIFDKKLQSKIN